MMKRFADIKKYAVLFGLVALSMLGFASAQSGGLGGLDEAATFLEEFLTWAKRILPILATVYFLWLVGMVLIERKQWSDVLMGIAMCFIAGAAPFLADWALSFYG